jgi:xylose isomerase
MDGWQSGPQPLRRSDELCRCPNDSVRKLAELGIYGINFHDGNFAPFSSDKATRDSNVSIFKKTLDEIGTKVPMAITNLFMQPFLRTVIDLQPKKWSIQNVMILKF